MQIYFEVFFIFNSRWLHVLVSKKYNIHLKTKRKNFKNAVAQSCLNESEYKGCFLTKDIELLDFETFLLNLCINFNHSTLHAYKLQTNIWFFFLYVNDFENKQVSSDLQH